MVGRRDRAGEMRGYRRAERAGRVRGVGILRWAGRLAAAFGVLCLILAATPASSLAAGSTFYADPFGTGTACTQPSPCSLSTALSQAGDGDTVQLASGNHGFANAAVQYTITHARCGCG
jgi:hypothetical protein